MNEGSLLKRTLVVTCALVGISAAWVAVVSVSLVTLVGRAISPASAVSETSVHSAPGATATAHAAAQNGASPAPPHARSAANKPNG